MPKIDRLECSRCGHCEGAETPQTVCPVCAGTYFVRYDLSAAKGTAVRDAIAEPAGGVRSMWRYGCGAAGRRAGDAGRRVDAGDGVAGETRNVLLKDEGTNPTGTFKARGLGLAVTMAKHYVDAGVGLEKLAVPSAGQRGWGTGCVRGGGGGGGACLYAPGCAAGQPGGVRGVLGRG